MGSRSSYANSVMALPRSGYKLGINHCKTSAAHTCIWCRAPRPGLRPPRVHDGGGPGHGLHPGARPWSGGGMSDETTPQANESENTESGTDWSQPQTHLETVLKAGQENRAEAGEVIATFLNSEVFFLSREKV